MAFQFAFNKSVKVPLRAKANKDRVPKFKACLPRVQKKSQIRATKESPVIPGSKLATAKRQQCQSILIDSDDSDHDVVDGDESQYTQAFVRRSAQQTTASTWLKDSVRPASSIPSRFRQTPTSDKLTKVAADQSQTRYMSATCPTLEVDSTLYQNSSTLPERLASDHSAMIMNAPTLHDVHDRDYNAIFELSPRFKYTPLRPRYNHHHRGLTGPVDSRPISAKKNGPPALGLDLSSLAQAGSGTEMAYEDVPSVHYRHHRELTTGSRPTTMRELKESGWFKRSNESSMSFCRRHPRRLPTHSEVHASTRSKFEPKQARSLSYVHGPIETDVGLNLASISDLELRMKVAMLLAIAPKYPIQDLYDLLVELKGHYEEARDQVCQQVCQNTGSSFHQAPMAPVCFASTASPVVLGNDFEGKDTIKVKLHDLNAWIDNDVTPSVSPAPSPPRSRLLLDKDNESRVLPQTMSKPKSKRSKLASGEVLTSLSYSKRQARYKPISKSTKPAKLSANKAGNRKQMKNRTRRSNSIDCDFVVDDEDTDFDSNGSYRDDYSCNDTDDSGTSDCVLEDLKKILKTDMRPFYVDKERTNRRD